MRLSHDPVGIAGEGPAGDGADKSLPVRERGNEEGDQLGQVRQHARHASL